MGDDDGSDVSAGLGLAPGARGCLFDLDGVLTATAKIHAQAWKKTFDTFLNAYDKRTGRTDQPFDQGADYENYVDGRTREDGIRSFLASRDIKIPDGGPEDAPGTESVYGIGEAKQWAFMSLLEEHGPQVYEGSVRYVHAARAAGLGCAVVTSSTNCKDILRVAGITDLFDATVDGHDVSAQHLRGKPAPDSYLAGAKALGIEPAYAAVFEDALSGVEAGHAGAFGTVVGVDRVGGDHAEHLKQHGATVVVKDLSELLGAANAEEKR
ncbi:beta-phosphoglucomutase family hydrolase [Actinospica sp.]|jgi:beta-phosphoglucomutase family hydrolase|uniref:HAD family hydrolase n=1 Tax=Actinospica sp. TaxID=1872142 RepID=UPI002CE950B4|nr:beta-phosphoglucomutase family hydrolase [Actinospica sp.]HWG28126.1 beta-phosphoglucomutase family hydrolase [Actinospica sp.]